MNVLVIGEMAEDNWIYGDVNRLNPEAPSVILNPTQVITNEGMAANVKNNLISLNPNIKLDFIHQETKIIKNRLCCNNSGYILIRVDINDKVDRIDNFTLKEIDFDKYDIVVVSDYNKGFLTEEDLQYISSKSKLSIIDTKKQIGLWACLFTFVKINKKEFGYQKEKDCISGMNMIVTLGKDGCMLYPGRKVFKYKENEVKNQAGLGDVFMAGFVTEYLLSKNAEKACEFANKASYIASTRRGVTVISSQDINNLP